jgi:hypothetical protein
MDRRRRFPQSPQRRWTAPRLISSSLSCSNSLTAACSPVTKRCRLNLHPCG